MSDELRDFLVDQRQQATQARQNFTQQSQVDALLQAQSQPGDPLAGHLARMVEHRATPATQSVLNEPLRPRLESPPKKVRNRSLRGCLSRRVERALPARVESLAPCCKEVAARVESLHAKAPLLEISRGIDFVPLLNTPRKGGQPGWMWHMTPIFEEEIAVRNGPWITLKTSNRRYIYSLASTWDGKPAGPAPIPADIVNLASEVALYRDEGAEDPSECEPLVLYKPEEWRNVRLDPALVAKVNGEWRCFAIWGGPVEEAEITLFLKKEEKV